MAQYDLMARMAPYLDQHLVIPLLEYIGPKKIYEEDSLFEAHRILLKGTNMVDTLIETYPDDQVPAELLAKRESILEEREKLKAETDQAVQILENSDVKEMMESARDREGGNKVLEYIQQKHDFKLEMLDSLFKYAKFQYGCGNYSAASICLYYYRNVVPQHDANYLDSLYGKLASEILVSEWSHAKDDLARLRAYIDTEPFDGELELLQHRAWVLHWALYVHFHKERDDIIEMFLHQPYLNTIQILCPHLLRYLTVAVVASESKRQSSMKELMRILEVERDNYSDPVTEFFACLCIDYNFDAAQQKLRECETVLTNDYFLADCFEAFQNGARLLMFHAACRIHNSISIKVLANRLGMEEGDAERWVVDLIRTFRLEGAKIDSQNGLVVMTSKPDSIHEQLVENGKRLGQRTQQGQIQIDRLRQDKRGAWKTSEVAQR